MAGMGKTANGKHARSEQRRRRRRATKPRAQWDALDAALRRAGLLLELPEAHPGPDEPFEPIAVRGEPVSATLLRERR